MHVLGLFGFLDLQSSAIKTSKVAWVKTEAPCQKLIIPKDLLVLGPGLNRMASEFRLGP